MIQIVFCQKIFLLIMREIDGKDLPVCTGMCGFAHYCGSVVDVHDSMAAP